MARLAYIDGLLRGVPQTAVRWLAPLVRVLAAEWQLGRPVAGGRAMNAKWVFVTGTTASVADREFAVAHGLDSIPHLAVPILPLGEALAKMVPLTITRAADARYIYLSSPETDAPFWLAVEGGPA